MNKSEVSGFSTRFVAGRILAHIWSEGLANYTNIGG